MSYHQSNFNPSSGSSESPIDKIREYTSKVEDLIDTYTQPIKPHLPALGRFLIVVTFLEDALRIITQWSDQKYYLQRHRHFPWGISHLFLLINVVVSHALQDIASCLLCLIHMLIYVRNESPTALMSR